jgi:hypothetical protein
MTKSIAWPQSHSIAIFLAILWGLAELVHHAWIRHPSTLAILGSDRLVVIYVFGLLTGLYLLVVTARAAINVQYARFVQGRLQ